MSDIETTRLIIKATLYDATDEARGQYLQDYEYLKLWYTERLKNSTDDQKASTMLAAVMFLSEICDTEGQPKWLNQEGDPDA